MAKVPYLVDLPADFQEVKLTDLKRQMTLWHPHFHDAAVLQSMLSSPSLRSCE